MDQELKQWLEAMEARTHERMGAMESRIHGRFEKIEARMDRIEARMDRMEARMDTMEATMKGLATIDLVREVETKLLTAFHGWSRPMEIKVREARAMVFGVDERLSLLEERISELERKRAS